MSEPTTTDPTSTPTEPGAHPALPEDTAPGTPSGNEPDRHEEEQEPRNRRHDPAADAAKYRHKLRETEAERDRIAQNAQSAQATAYDEITKALRAKGQALTHPDDLQRFTGKGPAEYLNDDGTLDRDALQADFDQLHADRPELFHSINYAPRPDRSQGRGTFSTLSGGRWKDAFRTRK